MSQDFGQGCIVIVRKKHRCLWCYEMIWPKEKAYHYKGMWENEWQDWRMHPECEEAYRKDACFDEGFLPGEGTRPRKEATA